MKTEKFVTLLEKITPDKEKKDTMLENILKSRQKNRFKPYMRYFTAAVSVFAVLTILYVYPMLNNEINNYSERTTITENTDLSYKDISDYLKYVPQDVLNEESYVGGRITDKNISLTFSNENLTVDIKLEPSNIYSGEYDDLKNSDSFTLTLDGGEYAVTYSILSQEGNIEDIIKSTEYFY